MPKVVELRDLAAQAQKFLLTTTTKTTTDHVADNQKDQTTRDFSHFGIEKLERVVLGEEMNLVKHCMMMWWATPYPHHFLTDDLVKCVTIEAFLVSQIDARLISETVNQ